jgi:DNA-binding NarL/FixJ family response regulator
MTAGDFGDRARRSRTPATAGVGSDAEGGSGERPMRVAVADDHALFRRGLAHGLARHGFEVAGETADGEELLALVRRDPPDVVVMDLDMPRMSGATATRLLAREAPLTRILVLTVYADDVHVREAILAGASGYLLKDATLAEVVAGIHAVAAGESLISPQIARWLLDEMGRTLETSAVPAVELSPRELSVLRLVAEGKSNADIASELYISAGTVKKHVSNLLAKLQLHNRIEAAAYAARKGII